MSQPSTNSQTSNPSSSQVSNSDVSWQPSHSQSSTVSQFSELLEDSDNDGTTYIFHFADFWKLCLENKSLDMSGSAIIVMWSCLLQLLTKCRHEGCGAQVNPDNISPSRNGELIVICSKRRLKKNIAYLGSRLKLGEWEGWGLGGSTGLTVFFKKS
jgi:hypothetical protein